MERMQHLTIARRDNHQEIQALKERIESDSPDPVLRLARDSVKGKSQQPNLESAHGMYDSLNPPFSMSIMTALLELDPYLAGAIGAIAVNVSACDMEIQWTGDGDENKK